MRRMTLAGGLAIAVSTVTLVAAPLAGATTYNNDAPIIIPEAGAANPYPSTIAVSGTASPITDVNVGLDGFTHDIPDDVIIALVAPSGQALLVQSCAGNAPAAGVFLTFDDAAAAQLPDLGPLATGTFKPTAHCAPAFPAPWPSAPANPGPFSGGTATLATAFNGLSAIGTWSLYVVDRNGMGGSGSIPGGWSLDVNPDVTPLPAATPTPTPTPAPAKKCKKKSGGKAGAAAKKGCKKKPKKRSG